MIRGLHLILALILAASALAKAASLVAAPRPDSPIYLPLQIAAIIMESLLEAWLASGMAAAFAHWCALVLFCLFAVVSLLQVLARAPSCGYQCSSAETESNCNNLNQMSEFFGNVYYVHQNFPTSCPPSTGSRCEMPDADCYRKTNCWWNEEDSRCEPIGTGFGLWHKKPKRTTEPCS